VVCSNCGQERPAGDRFCGICGTPLPHRLLSMEGTLSLGRGSWENSSSLHRMSTTAVGLLQLSRANTTPRSSGEAARDLPSQDSADSEIPSDGPLSDLAGQASSALETPDEAPPLSAELPSGAEVQEAPPVDSVDRFDQAPASQPEAATTISETPERQPNVSEFLDSLATTPAEPSMSNEAPHFPWMDDVLEQIELEAAKAAKTPAPSDDRPRFLDLLGDLSQPEVAQDAPVPDAVAPFSEAKQLDEPSTVSAVAIAESMPPSKKQRIWLPIAAVLVFVALAAVQWRSQITRNSMRMQQRITDKISQLSTGDEAAANKNPSAGSGDPIDLSNPPSQSGPTESQAKPRPQGPAANTSPPLTARNQTPTPTKLPTPPTAATEVQPPPAAQDEPTAEPATGPGAREMMRAKYAKTALERSEWLWKATAKGNPDAPVQLADLYVAGQGVPRSCEQAMVLLKTAALSNNVPACNRLASLYNTGTCVPHSQIEAYRWVNSALAVDPNNQAAQRNRDLIWQQLTPEERGLLQPPR
jgi:zinc-ribbon domain